MLDEPTRGADASETENRESLRIGVAAITRFHMFDLARELSAIGQRVSLFTGYPRWKVDADLRAIAQSRPSRLVWEKLAARLARGQQTNRWSRRTFSDFGRWLGRTAKSAHLQVLDALDGVGLEAGPVVRDCGGVWICNRGSTHILTQRELLRAEHARWGQPMPRSYFDPWMLDRCLAEYAKADAIVTPSTFARDSFLLHGHAPDRVFVCPYGVDLDMFRPCRKEDDVFRVIFIGTQSLQKGIGYLFEAVRPLVSARQVELWLAGTVSEDAADLLRKNADLFTHKGVQPRSSLAWFYSQASVLVLPSIQEGLALVQAQAMACGTPVIGTSNTGAADLFQDGVEGFIVPPRDPAAIRDRIQRLLDSPAKALEMSAAAQSRVQTLGGWRDYGRRSLEIYRQVLRVDGKIQRRCASNPA